MIELRPYQQECIRSIPARGAYLIQLATGLGKTVIFTQMPRRGRMLIISHREELVRQPLKYFDCKTGVEMAGEHAPADAEAVSASVQSLARRLDRYEPDAFDVVVVDEAHHASANTYKRILQHFRPRLLLGFTATPNRADKVRLDDIFEKIIFQRDLRWGVQNGWLSDILCRRVTVGYDLSAVKTRGGDFAPGELDEALDGTEQAVADAYRRYAEGATLIFAASVRHAQAIAAAIGPDAVVVTGETKNRADIIRDFTARKIKCLVNVMVFTEGTDIPLIETLIIARPTQSDSLYTQMVGRGLRLHPDKQRLNLIDCVGVTGSRHLCSAPSLLGISLDDIPAKQRERIQGDLFDLPDLATEAADRPESWIRNVKIVDLWAKSNSYNLHDVAWFKMPDGSLRLSKPRMIITAPDELGNVLFDGREMPAQEAYDAAYRILTSDNTDSKQLWDKNAVKRWGSAPATEKQKNMITARCGKKYPDIDVDSLTKGEAAMILSRVLAR